MIFLSVNLQTHHKTKNVVTCINQASCLMPESVTIVKPLLKWVGGKSQIIADIIETFPRDMSDYHEPFVGGGSVLLALLSYRKAGLIKVNGDIHACDKNLALISLYKNIQSRCDAVREELESMVKVMTDCGKGGVNRKPENFAEAISSQESFYYWTRQCFNNFSPEELTSPKGTATFMFLNKTCFRGVYREGPKGFNVPFGHHKNPCVFDKAHMAQVSSLIQGVYFHHCSFEESINDTRCGSFMYLDPPYAPINAKSFVGYTGDGFNKDQHKLLFKLCDEVREKGVRFVMSNADVPYVRGAFSEDKFSTRVVSCRRAINSKNPAARVDEVIIQTR